MLYLTNTQIMREIFRKSPKTDADLATAKRKIAKQNGKCPSNIELLKAYRDLRWNGKIKENKNLEKILQKNKMRTLSGVVVVAVLTKPYPCPGACIYCPTVKGMPKSYLPKEPAVMRAILNDFDPYRQVKTRLQALYLTGHPTDKIELIIIGGTWSYLPKNYQTWFIKRCFEVCNSFSAEPRGTSRRTTRKIKNSRQFVKNSFSLVLKQNEKAKHRIIGLTLETRPDFITKKEVKRMRTLGATRVELGAQSLYDDILDLNKRGHKIEDLIKATKLLKETGFKVVYHMMPGLPASTPQKDLRMFKTLFSDSRFQPDKIKIYPCVVLKNSKLYGIWQKGKYKPYGDKTLVNLLVSIKKEIPYYCRIIRIIRDIPSNDIVAGNKISNLRQILKEKMKEKEFSCKCIRCREIKAEKFSENDIKLFRQDYDASGGKEIFLSFETKDRKHILAFLRLRIPEATLKGQKNFIATLTNSAVIREIHTYGNLKPISSELCANPRQSASNFSNYPRKSAMRVSEGSAHVQHQGLGKQLMAEAEKIARQEFGAKKMAVISGVGVREYYRKLGYKLKKEYMVKVL